MQDIVKVLMKMFVNWLYVTDLEYPLTHAFSVISAWCYSSNGHCKVSLFKKSCCNKVRASRKSTVSSAIFTGTWVIFSKARGCKKELPQNKYIVSISLDYHTWAIIVNLTRSIHVSYTSNNNSACLYISKCTCTSAIPYY